MAQSLKYLLFSPFQEKFANTWSETTLWTELCPPKFIRGNPKYLERGRLVGG